MRLFPECVVDVIEDLAAATLTEPTSLNHITPSSKPSQPLIVHYIAGGTPSTSSVKFFKLRDLPEGVLERSLAPKGGKSTKALANSMSCRLTRWPTSKRDHIFNGRVGTPITTNSIIDNNPLHLNTFIVINNQRQSLQDTNEAIQAPAKHWRFVGDVPTVQQWQEGMGETEPFDPNYMPDPPKDAERFMHRPIQPAPTLVRSRVPKPAAALYDSSEDEESEEETNQLDFGKLLAQGSRNKQRACDDQDGSQSAESGEGLGGFEGLLARGATTSKAPQPTPRAGNAQTTTKVAVRGAAATHNPHNTAVPPSTDPSEPSCKRNSFDHDAYFPKGNQFAKVDEAGLTSNAANQARWEHSNPVPRKPKSNRSGIVLRGSQASAQSSQRPTSSSVDAPVSQSTGREPPLSHSPPSADNLSSLKFDPTTASGYAEAQSDVRDWTNNINRQASPMKKLINDFAPATRFPVRPPPGLEFGPHNGAQSDNTSQRVEQRPSQNGVTQDNSPSLIDLSDDEANNTRLMVKRPKMKLLTPCRWFQ